MAKLEHLRREFAACVRRLPISRRKTGMGCLSHNRNDLVRRELTVRPKILGRKILCAGYLTVERLRLRLIDGAEVWREVERHGDAVAMLPYSIDRRCALVVRLFRAPVFDATGVAIVEEACAGMIGDEDAETAARREAYEELGVAIGPLEFVARIWSSPGVSTERQSLFLASYSSADRIDDGGGVDGEHENITVSERPLVELAAAADQGRIEDGKLLSLVFALRLRRPELFHAAA
jgi:nudix-type nucleoside diphosphatase (YffH/AdpP family)